MRLSVADMERVFPEMCGISSEELKKQITCVWNDLLDEGKWDHVEEARFSVTTPVTLVNHTRAVMLNCIQIADHLIHFHKLNVSINMDILLAACMLHDVCKIIEIEPCENEAGCRISDTGNLYQHGFYSAYYAEKAGMEPVIVSMLLSHTIWSRVMPDNIEGKILFYADEVDAEMNEIACGGNSHLMATMGKKLIGT